MSEGYCCHGRTYANIQNKTRLQNQKRARHITNTHLCSQETQSNQNRTGKTQMMHAGKWIVRVMDAHQITRIELSDYSGIHIRKLHRILSNQSALSLLDFVWLMECLADMTNQDKFDLMMDCLRYMYQK